MALGAILVAILSWLETAAADAQAALLRNPAAAIFISIPVSVLISVPVPDDGSESGSDPD